MGASKNVKLPCETRQFFLNLSLPLKQTPVCLLLSARVNLLFAISEPSLILHKDYSLPPISKCKPQDPLGDNEGNQRGGQPPVLNF